jgi:hypothetical protein
MAYKPEVEEAKIVSNNPNNGLYEVVVSLKDRTKCRLVFEKDAQGGSKVTNIARLYKEPCPICRKDFLCYCMNKYMEDISTQAAAIVGTP